MRALELLKDLLVAGMRRLCCINDAVEVFDHLQRVLVRSVAMKELVLHQTGQPTEFRNIFSEELHLVHPTEYTSHLSFVFQNSEERIASFLGILERAVNQLQVLSNLRSQLRAHINVPLLRVVK